MRLLLCAKFTSLSVCSVLAVHICCTFSKFSFICLLKHLLFTFPNCSLCLQALTKTTDKIVFEYRQYIHVIQKSQSSIKCVSWNFIYTHCSLLTLLLFPNTRWYFTPFSFFYYGFFLLHSYSPTMNLLFYFTPFPFPLFPPNSIIYAYAIYFRFIFTIVFLVVITVLVVVLVITISIYIIILSGLIPVLSC